MVHLFSIFAVETRSKVVKLAGHGFVTLSRGELLFLAGLKPDLFIKQNNCRLFSEARARLMPYFFRKKIKPKKSRAQSMKPEPDPNPEQSGPTHLNQNKPSTCQAEWFLLVFIKKNF
jgi:hypothetical protein